MPLPAAASVALPRLGQVSSAAPELDAATVPSRLTSPLAGGSSISVWEDDPKTLRRDKEVLAKLLEAQKGRRLLSYGRIKRALRREVDGVDGTLTCPYTGFQIETKLYQPTSGWNLEHSYGQAACPAAKADLHHLWLTDAFTNNRRSIWGNVDVVQSTRGLAKWGLDARGHHVFEPPDSHKGRLARAHFYVALVYGVRIPNQALLRAWDKAFPPDAAERARNDRIEGVQNNRNPFIDDRSLIDSISFAWGMPGHPW